MKTHFKATKRQTMTHPININTTNLAEELFVPLPIGGQADTVFFAQVK
jgi:hypothetical protein